MAERERIPLEYQPQLADEYETDVPPEDEAYSLEEILEEYGGGLERKLSEGAGEPAEPLEEKRRTGLRLSSLAERIRRKPRPEPDSWDAVPRETERRETVPRETERRETVPEDGDGGEPVREEPNSRDSFPQKTKRRRFVRQEPDRRTMDRQELDRRTMDRQELDRRTMDRQEPDRRTMDRQEPDYPDRRTMDAENLEDGELVREEPDGGAEPPDTFPPPEEPVEPEEPEAPDTEPPSFTEKARETAERAGRVLDGLRGLLRRIKETVQGAASAARQALGGIRLPALPSGTRIPVLSAVGDRIEAARRKRRPKRNHGQPVPIPGRRKKKPPVPPEDSPEGMEPGDAVTAADGAEARAGRLETIEPDAAAQEEPRPAGKTDRPEPFNMGTDGPETHNVETDGPETHNVETDGPEPSNVETDGPEPSNVETDGPEPSSVGTDSPEPFNVETNGPEPSSVKMDGPVSSSVGTDGPEPSNMGTDSPESRSVGTDGPELSNMGTDGPEPPNMGTDRTVSHGAAGPEPSRAAERPTRRPLFQRLAALRVLFQQRKRADEGPVGPEIPLHDAAARFREAYTRRQVPPLALSAGGLPTLLLLLEWLGIAVPLWTDVIPFRCFLTLLCIAATAYLCRQVFTGSVTAFACGVSAAAAGCDCLVRMVSASRSPGDGFGAVACLALIVAQWGVSLESRGRFEAFRAASLDDDPPYLVTDMAQGACKQKGATPGFYSTAMRPDLSTIWQAVLLPLTLTVSLVFAGISSFGRDRPADFFLNWSAILAAGATFTLALCWGLPWARLARRLQRSGGAVAGWAGAEKIARQKNMIVTDADLFPTGTVQLNGIRLFGGDMDVAVSYAAAITREAACGLERPFDELMHTELGESAEAPEAEEFNFYEEGGYGAVINGQPVLMGTAAFLRRMGVLLPRDLKVPSGMFLAVDHRLLAVFAIRYNPADNVDYALRMMRRSGVTPLLAVRDPNITPAMLQRKFRRRIPARYPDLAGRIALSEVEFDRDAPRALLFREGLLPYAEAVVGCRRLCGGVRRATILSEFGSVAGMLLTFYLCSQGKFELLTPLALIVFLLLWLIPVLLVMELF